MYILIIGTKREILRALSGIQVSLDNMKQEQDNHRRPLSYMMRKLEGSTHVAMEEEMAGTIDEYIPVYQSSIKIFYDLSVVVSFWWWQHCKDNTVKRAFGNLKLAAAILSMYISEVPVKAISDQNQCNIHLRPPENPTDDIMIKM